MSLSFLDCLEIQVYRIELRLQDPVQFHFFHGPALYGLLCNALNRHPLGPEIALFPVESGRIEYRKSDRYNFGLTLIGHCPGLAEQIRSGLIRMGQDPPVGKTIGAFSVIEFEWLPLPEMQTDFHDEMTLQFMTPLRMERLRGARGRQFFDAVFFDAARFLRLLHDRTYDLCKLSEAPLPAYQVPDIPKTQISDMSLTWVDVPYTKTLGGVVGFVKLRAGMSEGWKRLLELGQSIGVGRNTAMGLGRYLVNPCPESLLLKPARTLLDLAISPSNLVEAFERIRAAGEQAGVDGETIEDFENNLFANLAEMVDSIRAGRYRSAPFEKISSQRSSGKAKSPAIPTVRDRLLQQAVTQTLKAAFDIFLRENSYAHRSDRSSERVAVDKVDWAIMERKLRSLFVFDPIVDIILDWTRQDMVIEDLPTKRSRGLPQGAAISPLLSSIYARIS